MSQKRRPILRARRQQAIRVAQECDARASFIRGSGFTPGPPCAESLEEAAKLLRWFVRRARFQPEAGGAK